jgi:tetratricopeptide (TPR) repeat protein
MEHPTEEQLAEYALDPDGSAGRAGIEEHVADCPRCSSTLTFIRSVDATLTDPDTWAMADSSEAAAREELRQIAGRAAEEDEAAEELLHGMLGEPALVAWKDLGVREEYRTAGVVRRLVGAANEACEREPLEALTFADSAIDIAERLERYPPSVLHDLRATAWKERANALRLLGRYDAALEALTHAEREFRRAPGAPLGEAIVGYIRGIVYFERGDLTRAGELYTQAAETFSNVGEVDRYMRARHGLANVLREQGDIRSARATYEEILAWAEARNDLKWIARESNVLGRCAFLLRDFSAAVQYFYVSAQAFRELGLLSEAVRPEWGLALVVAASGRAADALVRLGHVRRRFHEGGMLSDEALVALDMMDSLHILERHDEIAVLARELIDAFVHAGMLTSALAAFGYLAEAAKQHEIDPPRIEYVRQFLGRLSHEPALLFAPPANLD